MSERAKSHGAPPGYIVVTSKKTGKPIHVNAEKICAYGVDGLELDDTWILVSSREALIWTSTSMDEIAEKIEKEFYFEH